MLVLLFVLVSIATDGVFVRCDRYKGLGPTLVSGAPYVGIQMSFFEVFKRLASDAIGGGEPSMLLKLVLGASAGVTAQTITYPGDVVRRRMQTDGINGKARM